MKFSEMFKNDDIFEIDVFDDYAKWHINDEINCMVKKERWTMLEQKLNCAELQRDDRNSKPYEVEEAKYIISVIENIYMNVTCNELVTI